ncbi:hypothetical protein CLCR_05711 [Cladophialophora carrionii]|uniref:Uncharacterized protein n=1 Tax=Cladophialophora carrionii TaxID=86049 RepID=A0A1C1CA29_9EURO|nr:hypothetical protein CLCR_05711 [Cladophialophora carrionii]
MADTDLPSRNRKRAASPEVDHPRKSHKRDHEGGIMEEGTPRTSIPKSLKRKPSESNIVARELNPAKRIKADGNQASLSPVAAAPGTIVEAAPASMRPPASLLTIEPEVRLEILRHLLLLERNQVVTCKPSYLSEVDFDVLAKHPYAVQDRFTPGQWHSAVTKDYFLQSGLQREFHYRPQLQILRVCKRLKEEGEDVFHNENHYISVHGAPDDLINKLRRLGVCPQRWRGACERLMPQIVLTIDFRPTQPGSRPDRLLFPPSNLRRLSLALYSSNLFEAPNMTESQRMHIRIYPSIHLLKAFRQKELAGVKDLLQNDLVDWIGTECTGCLANGIQTLSQSDRSVGEASSSTLARYPSVEKMSLHMRQMRDDFEKAYALHLSQGLPAAMQDYLDLRDRIWFVARNCPNLATPSLCKPVTVEWRLLCMLSWILFHIASVPSIMTSRHWRVLFAQRALTLPSYVPRTEWKVRVHLLTAGILRSFRDLQYSRFHHLARAGSLLESGDARPWNQVLRGLTTVKFDRTLDESGWEMIRAELQKGLKKEMEKQYGKAMVIPHSSLDDELMGAMVHATPSEA